MASKNRLEHLFSTPGKDPNAKIKTTPAPALAPAIPSHDEMVARLLAESAKMAKHNASVHRRICQTNRDFDELMSTDKGKNTVLRSILIGEAQNNHMLSLILSGITLQLDSQRADEL